MKKLMLLMLAGSVLVFNSCSKTGSQGPQGPAGYDGNANVLGSNSFPVSSWTYSPGTSSQSPQYSASFTDQDITTDIVDHGIVEVFKQYSDGSWTNLPDINGVTSTVFNFYDNGFTIYIINTDGTIPLAPGTINFRTVVISASQRQAHPNTNWKNYNEAMAALGNTKATASAQ